MKNVKIVICVNIIVIFIILLCFENYYYKIYVDRTNDKKSFFGRYINNEKFEYNFRFVTQPDKPSGKPPILMIGCSYTYGQWLDNPASSQLAELTGRTVYNTGVIGGGINDQLQFFYDQEKNPKIDTPPEYIIYTYMFHHIDRWQSWKFFDALRKSGVIPNQPYNFLYRSFIYSYIQNTKFDMSIYSTDSQIKLFIDALKAVVQKSKELYPNSKFVVLIYSDVNKELNKALLGENNQMKERMDELFDIMYSDSFRQQLKSTGAIVISTEELIGRKMDRKEDRVPYNIDHAHPHPSEKAWSLILPKLIEKLNIGAVS